MKHWLSAIVVNVCRLILGATFVAGGMTKVLDPAGMEHKLMAYLRNWDVLTWTDGTAWLTTMVISLATVECLLGIWLLLGIRRKLTTRVTTLLTLAFTALTVYIYVREPVPDCGCFGEAVKLTHGETLLKNIALLILCLPPLLQPLKIKRFIRKHTQWIPSLYAAIFVVACGIYSSNNGPLVDFTSYVPGYSFNAAMEGKFGEKGVADAFNFAVMDSTGSDITLQVTLDTGYTFLAIAPRLEFVDCSVSDRITEIHERAATTGDCRFFFLTSSGNDEISRWRDITGATYEIHHTDEGVLAAAAKTNPGLLLLHGDTIVGKWGKRNLPTLKDAQNSPVPVSKMAQKAQNTPQKLLKIIAWLFVPLIFIIFADGLAAGTVSLHRRSLKKLARSRLQQRSESPTTH